MTVRRYQILSRCNQAVIHATAEQPLYITVCRTLVDMGGYALVWAGVPHSDYTFQISAAYGEDPHSIVKSRPSWNPVLPSGNGPTGRAFRSRDPIFINDLTHENPHLQHMPTNHQGLAPHFQGMAALPLVVDDQALGVMVVYTYTLNGFDDDEKSFLTILAEDIAFGVKVLRERRHHQRTETRLQSTFDLAGDSIAVVNAHQELTYINRAAEQTFGYSASEAIGQPIWLVVPDRLRTEYATSIAETIADAGDNGSLVRFLSLTLRRRDGTEFPCQASIAYVRDDISAYFTIILRDQTESQRLTQTLAAKEQELRQIIDAVPHGIFIRDRNGDILLANKALALSYGMQAEEMVGLNYRQLHPELAEVNRFLADDQLVVQDMKQRVAPEFEFTMPDGSRCVHQVIKVPVHLATRNETAILGVAVDITMLKVMQETLATSRDMLEAVFANAPIGIAMLYEESIVWANPSLCEMTGYLAEHIKDVTLPQLFPTPIAYESARDTLFRPTENGQRHREIATQWQRYSGEVFHCFVRLTRLDKRSSVMMAMDISETRASIDALQESLLRYHLLFDGSPDGIFILNQSGDIIEANMSVGEMMGYERGELIGHHPSELSPPTQPDGLDSHTKAARSIWAALSGKPQHFEWVHQRKDGSTFYCEVQLHPLELDGELQVQAIVHDIDERKQAEARFVKIFHASPDPISISSLRSGYYYDVNDAFLELTGLPREHIIGHTVEEVGLWETAQDRQTLVERLLTEGALRGHEVSYTALDGQRRVMLLSAEIIDLGGDEPFVLTLGKDITERVAAEKAMRERDQLEIELLKEREMGELKSRFVTLASHEFRTPLATILAAAGNLQRYFDRMDDDQRNRQFHKINTTIMALTKMLDDILMVGHADSGMLYYAPHPAVLGTFCHSLFEDIRAAHDPDHRILCNVHRLPDESVMLDEKLMRHIVLNLLTNALKYSTETVTADLTYADGWGTIVVTDTGIGIAEADHAMIYEAFQRGGNVGQLQGTGLGLAVVKLAVDLWGGSIEFVSSVGQGTTFTVRLPMPPATDADKGD